ncbi:MAG: sensor histidine kinase [Cytophagales bacterium]|nr:sensor histidine kinase [Cytophagales bacterium]
MKVFNWRPLPHLLFWAASLYFIAYYFSISGALSSIDVIYSISFHGCLILLVYLNLGLLIPKLLQKGHYVIYLLGLMFIIALAIVAHYMVFEIMIPIVLVDYYIVSFVDTLSLVLVFSIYLALTSLLKFSKSWFRIQQLETENMRFQLNSLKEQLNPHFLFNGLNSIYALAIQKSEKTPEAILILSELLRFSLYEINKEKVELSQEIKNMEHYLALQKLRLKGPHLINFRVIGDPKDITVPPMIFLPILENAFKHGDLKKAIKISLLISETIQFHCENQIDHRDHPELRQGGIGLENIKKRLDLLYPDASLDLNNEENLFIVQVKFTIP